MLGDPKLTSVQILESHCREWFHKQGLNEPWFPERPYIENPFQKSGPIDVVLMGDALDQIYKSIGWPKRDYRLWVMGTGMQNVCSKLTGIPKEYIRVIPRYALFPLAHELKPFPKQNQKWTLIFSGRVAYVKHIYLLLRVVSCLQMDFEQDVHLVFMGPFDEKETPRVPFSKELVSLIEELNWKYPPQYLGDLGTKEWAEISFENPIIVSLSTYTMDDFGVSIAQAQQKGWPCLLSNWGGHLDVQGANVLKISPYLLFFKYDKQKLTRGLAYAIAEQISEFQQKISTRLVQHKKEDSFNINIVHTLPEVMSWKELSSYSLAFKEKYSLKKRIFIRRRNFSYRKSLAGQRLLFDLRSAFTTSNFVSKDVTIVSVLQYEGFWESLKEICPAIEAAWFWNATSDHRTIHFSPLFKNDIRRLLILKKADRIVVTVLTNRIIKDLIKIRTRLNPNANFIIYTHGEFTTAGVKIKELVPFLRSSDVFISASHAEANTIKLCFSNANVLTMPFPLGDSINLPKSKCEEKDIYIQPKDLVYVGRLSEQKNIHTLLLSLWYLKTLQPNLPFKLHIFGEEDNYGSPNMGVHGVGYLKKLKKYIEELNLETHVILHGHKTKSFLENKVFSKKYIYVSPSLHSDEDFGVSAFRTLMYGNQAILSAWGGHFELSKNFKEQVDLIPVYKSKIGPFVSPIELAEVLIQTLQEPNVNTNLSKNHLKQYKYKTYREKLKKIIFSTKKINNSEPLKKTKLVSKIWSQNSKENSIFIGYDDKLAQPFFEAYGMQNKYNVLTKKNHFYVPIWVHISKKQIVIDDPHRGRHVFKVSSLSKNKQLVSIMSKKTKIVKVDQSSIDWLIEMGAIF